LLPAQIQNLSLKHDVNPQQALQNLQMQEPQVMAYPNGTSVKAEKEKKEVTNLLLRNAPAQNHIPPSNPWMEPSLFNQNHMGMLLVCGCVLYLFHHCQVSNPWHLDQLIVQPANLRLQNCILQRSVSIQKDYIEF
jgi:hypothetical protein